MIYLDMDGVLVDFVGGLRHRYMITKPWPLMEYDPIKAFGLPETMWMDLDKTFWMDLQPTAECEELLSKIKDYRIATSAYNEECLAGKLEWSLKYTGHKPIFIDEKWLLARHNDWLIDDNDKQHHQFILEGGRSFLFPRDWNLNHSNDWRSLWSLIPV